MGATLSVDRSERDGLLHVPGWITASTIFLELPRLSVLPSESHTLSLTPSSPRSLPSTVLRVYRGVHFRRVRCGLREVVPVRGRVVVRTRYARHVVRAGREGQRLQMQAEEAVRSWVAA